LKLTLPFGSYRNGGIAILANILLAGFFNKLISRFIIPGAKSIVKADSRRLLKFWGNVRIGIKGYLFLG